MSSQDGNPLSDASTTRPVLTPPSEVSHKSSDGAGSGTKKRKRDGNTVEDLLKDPFVVKVGHPYLLLPRTGTLTKKQPYPSTTFVKPRTLQPLLLLPRSHLPLSSLDITPSPNGLPQSRLFETRVKILELEERMGSQHMVLIARLDEGKSLYAVERETRGLYVLLRLGSWVDLQQLRAAALVSKQDLPRASERLRVPGAIPQAAPVMTPESSQYSKKKRLAIEAIQSMVKRPSVNLSTEATPTEALPTHTSLEASMVSQSSEKLDSSLSIGDATQPTAGEIFENVRNQYFEALYLSKVCPTFAPVYLS
jgi:DNA replication regulator SLD3